MTHHDKCLAGILHRSIPYISKASLDWWNQRKIVSISCFDSWHHKLTIIMGVVIQKMQSIRRYHIFSLSKALLYLFTPSSMQFYTWPWITFALLHSLVWCCWQLRIWAQAHQTNIQELAVTKSDCPVASCPLSRAKPKVIYLTSGLKGCQQQLSSANPVGHTAQTRPQGHRCSSMAPTLPDD